MRVTFLLLLLLCWFKCITSHEMFLFWLQIRQYFRYHLSTSPQQKKNETKIEPSEGKKIARRSKCKEQKKHMLCVLSTKAASNINVNICEDFPEFSLCSVKESAVGFSSIELADGSGDSGCCSCYKLHSIINLTSLPLADNIFCSLPFTSVLRCVPFFQR